MARYTVLYSQKQEVTDAYKAAVAPLDAEMSELKMQLFGYAEANQADFNGKKTMALACGTIGFKLGNKAVSFPLDAPDDIKEKYLATVKKELPAAIVESVDSKKVIGAWDMFPNLSKKLAKLGISVGQEDSFFVTPKLK
ncbi:host-nuclease inhibitor Gam family protein [Hymenobacter sp. B81]|uniref:host-nuclease inhibitor Gam family protein n=1 Tax=Hymenobacter sp. B81 TaxID=3344878 RepID=UPI0037DCCCBA